MSDDLELSARLGAMTNLIHGFIYFVPQATEEYAALGLPPTHHYFASRGAALGAVPANVIVATFFNFNPTLVEAVIPEAWHIASPAAIQQARMRAAGRVLRELAASVDMADIEQAFELAGTILAGVGDEGRPLAAGNRAVPEPDDAWQRLWQRLTVLREWRGDSHVAVLVAHGLDPVEALILHAGTGQVPRAALMNTRQWPDPVWRAGVDRLAARGLVEDDEALTEAGRAYREEIEQHTNAAALQLVRAAGSDETNRLLELLRPVRRALLDGGAFAMMSREPNRSASGRLHRHQIDQR